LQKSFIRPRAQPHPVPGGSQLFHRLYTRLGGHGRPPQFIVEFYPYAGLAHTIRVRDETAYVRLSDALRGAPAGIIEAAAVILLSRILRRRTPRQSLDEYRQFALAPATRRRVDRLRRSRARRVAGGPQGHAHDLAPMFSRLNRRYFAGRLRRPRLGWSVRHWRTQLGCFDPALDQIVLNRRLDRAGVPAFVVEYVLFHEMLHVKHPLRATRCHMQAHTREFLKEEKRFPQHAQARRYLNRLA
jgi:YgjP-like, metallopeptidase domain